MLGARIEKARAAVAATARPQPAGRRPAAPRVRNLQRRHQARGRLLRSRATARSPASSRSKARARTSCSPPSPARSGPSGGTHRGRRQAGAASPIPPTPSRAGIAYVPGDRTEALLMQRSVRENIALPFSARLAQLGPDRHAAASGAGVAGAIERLQIDTRAQREVQRLSGGNQQKVTIARWIAADARTILCFDPTRGIDVRTKQEIYRLLRELAGAGQVGALLHLRARGGAARLRPRHRHLRRPRRRRPAGRDRRRGGADARRLRPAARRRRPMSASSPSVRASRRARHDPLPPPQGLGRRACSCCSRCCSSSPS